ncbi:MAG: HEAT repeat domain-containing protein, partial [Candidatus Omnitrophota bacterium]
RSMFYCAMDDRDPFSFVAGYLRLLSKDETLSRKDIYELISRIQRLDALRKISIASVRNVLKEFFLGGKANIRTKGGIVKGREVFDNFDDTKRLREFKSAFLVAENAGDIYRALNAIIAALLPPGGDLVEKEVIRLFEKGYAEKVLSSPDRDGREKMIQETIKEILIRRIGKEAFVSLTEHLVANRQESLPSIELFSAEVDEGSDADAYRFLPDVPAEDDAYDKAKADSYDLGMEREKAAKGPEWVRDLFPVKTEQEPKGHVFRVLDGRKYGWISSALGFLSMTGAVLIFASDPEALVCELLSAFLLALSAYIITSAIVYFMISKAVLKELKKYLGKDFVTPRKGKMFAREELSLWGYPRTPKETEKFDRYLKKILYLFEGGRQDEFKRKIINYITKRVAVATQKGYRHPIFNNLPLWARRLINVHESFKSHTVGMLAMMPGFGKLVQTARSAKEERHVPQDVKAIIRTSIKTLKESDEKDTRVSAAEAIGRIGPIAVEAVPALLYVLGDQDTVVRQAALKALQGIGYLEDTSKKPGFVLVEALGDKDAKIRKAAAQALGNVGPVAKKAIPDLMVLHGDPDPSVRQAALEATSKIDKTKGLSETSDALRRARRKTPSVDDVSKIPVLIEQLSDAKTRNEARLGLINAGRDAVPALMGALKNADVIIRREALNVLAFTGVEKEEEVSAVIEAFEDPDMGVRGGAMVALSNISPDAQKALSLLLEVLTHEVSNFRDSAMTALARIGYISRDEKDRVSVFIKVLMDRERVDLRKMAVKALEKIGEEAKGAAPALVNILADRTVQKDVLFALRRIKPDPKIAVPALVTLLSAQISVPKKGLLRCEIVKTLGGMGPAAVSAVPALKERLKDRSTMVRDAAKEALDRIQPGWDSGRGPTINGTALGILLLLLITGCSGTSTTGVPSIVIYTLVVLLCAASGVQFFASSRTVVPSEGSRG